MKNSKSLAIIFLIQIAFLPIFQCRVIIPMDATLINQTCKKTPFYNLCVSSLKSDPRSSSADVASLGLIMVNVLKVKSTDTLNTINELITKRPGDKALESCAHFYKTIIEADIPEAVEAFVGNPKFAEQGMNDAAGEAETCETAFSGRSKSPLTDKNKVVHDVAAVAAAIARSLL